MNKESVLSRLDFKAFYGGLVPSLRDNGKSQATGLCPFHEDHNPSLSVNLEKGLYNCFACGARGDAFRFYQDLKGVDFPTSLKEIAEMQGIAATTDPCKKIKETYPYFDENGDLLFQVVRFDPKGFAQRRPDGKCGYTWNMEGVRRVLYRLSEVLKAETVFVVEGEKDAEALRALNLTATTNPGGAGKWQENYSEGLRGKRVVIFPDNDRAGKQHAQAVAQSLHGVAASVKIAELPGLPEKGDVSDWLEMHDAKETPDILGELNSLIEATPEWKPERTTISTAIAEPLWPPGEALQAARATIQKWLKLECPDLIDLILAVREANELPGDPVWLLIVGPSSSIKSELIRGLRYSPGVYVLSSLTARTFASGFEKVPSLLDKLANQGIILLTLKDFGSVLSLHPQDKAEVLQQLREIYDGHYRKEFGNGKVVEWHGRLGFLAGTTPAIDRYTSVIGELGDRFILYRISVKDRDVVAWKALSKSGQEDEMRSEIAAAFRSVIEAIGQGDSVDCVDALKGRIATLANLTSWARTPVSRDWRSQAIQYHPEPEGPGRLVKALYKLAQGLALVRGRPQIGESEYAVLLKIAQDTIPSQRLRILKHLQEQDGWMGTKEVGLALSMPTPTVQLALEEMALLRLIHRCADIEPGEEIKQTTPFKWKITDEVKAMILIVNLFEAVTS